MARRGNDCQCCAGCEKCNPAPALLSASVSYPSGGGIMIEAGTTSGLPPVPYANVSTQCRIDADRVGIARARITNPGSGYTSPPFFTVTGGGGAITFGSVTASFVVTSISVTNGGSGYSQNPTVSPGLSFAVVEGAVSSVSITAPGLGYKTPPEVVFAGGAGATAVATIDGLGRLTSIQITNGGSKYTPNPQVFLEGGDPVVPASATATISGSVVRVEVIESQIFQQNRNNSGQVSGTLPGVTFSGSATTPAQATATYEGKVTALTLEPFNSSGYTSPPVITFTGGGGSGAQAVAELTWQPAYVRTAAFNNCLAGVGYFDCVSSTSDAYPPSSGSSACERGRSEVLSWSALASTAAGQARLTSGGQLLAGSGPLIRSAWFFPGEAIFAVIGRGWSSSAGVFREETSFALSQPLENCSNSGRFYSSFQDSHQEIYVRRFFSRVPPNPMFSVAVPEQGDATSNAVFSVEFRQYVDAKGDSVWYVEEISLVSPGQNLFVPIGTSTITLGTTNSRQRLTVPASFTYGAPQATTESLPAFNSQPVVALIFTPFSSSGSYQLANASIGFPGTTNAPDGTTVSLVVAMTAGHMITRPNVLGVIQGGKLHSVTVALGGEFVGPASVATVGQLPADSQFNAISRFLVGESDKVVERSHSSPVLSAAADVVSGDGGTFAITTAIDTDENGDAFWRVVSATVVEQPSGLLALRPPDFAPSLIIEPEGNSIARVPAIAYLVFGREAPDESQLRSGSSTESGFVAFFENFVVSSETDSFGDVFWKVTSAQLTAQGQALQGLQVGSKFSVQGLAGQVCRNGEITVTGVDDLGRITSWEITEGGVFFQPTNTVVRVAIVDGGRYFVRTFTETTTPLGQADNCLGPVSEANGWQKTTLIRSFYNVVTPSVGGSFTSRFSDVPGQFSRVRRCDLPTVTVELS